MHPINIILKKFGIKISRISPEPPPWRDIMLAKAQIIRSANPVIFDVGASRGNYAEGYIKIFSPCKIFCFEPLADCIVALKSRFINNSSVETHQLALSDKTGSADFFCNALDETSSLLPFSPAAEMNWEGVDIHTNNSIPVECITLDDFLEKHAIQQVDILKIDVQGAEMAVLRGAEKALDAGRIKVIFFEIITCDTYKNQPAIQDYLKFLDSKNYGLVGFYDQANGPDGQLRQLDALFAHRSLFHN
jgi:FkbM family methyltransferase